MRTILFAMALMVLVSVGADAEDIETIHGDVHLTKTTDDFTDEYSEMIGVMEESTFMPKMFVIRFDEKNISMIFQHHAMILEDKGTLMMRVNDHKPTESSVVYGDSIAFTLKGEADPLFQELVDADKAGEVEVVVMIKGEPKTKFKFSMNGIAEAVDHSKVAKTYLSVSE